MEACRLKINNALDTACRCSICFPMRREIWRTRVWKVISAVGADPMDGEAFFLGPKLSFNLLFWAKISCDQWKFHFTTTELRFENTTESWTYHATCTFSTWDADVDVCSFCPSDVLVQHIDPLRFAGFGQTERRWTEVELDVSARRIRAEQVNRAARCGNVRRVSAPWFCASRDLFHILCHLFHVSCCYSTDSNSRTDHSLFSQMNSKKIK